MFRGFALAGAAAIRRLAHAWWARVAVTGGYGYLLADNADLAGWQSWLRSVAGGDLAEYRDFGGGVYRAASFADERIETCLFVGPARDAGDWDVVKNPVRGRCAQRRSAPHAVVGQIRWMVWRVQAPIVCACFGVGRATICDAIAGGRALGGRNRRAS